MKKDGKIATSIWGRRENSPYFKIFPEIMVNHGVQFPKQKSYFHISDKLDTVFKQAGFKNVKLCYQMIYLNDSKETIVAKILSSPFFKTEWDKLTLPTQQSIITEFFKYLLISFVNFSFSQFNSKFGESTLEMIGFESIIAVASK